MEIYDYITCSGASSDKNRGQSPQLFMESANDYSLRAFDRSASGMHSGLRYMTLGTKCLLIFHKG